MARAAAAEEEGCHSSSLHDDDATTLPHRLTVLVTSSPVRSNPDTSLLRRVFDSFLLVPGLVPVRKLIICDGYVVANKAKFKKGTITADIEADYAEYKARLRALIRDGQGAFKNTELVELEERSGFGYACKVGADMAVTPYVLIVQHDRIFHSPVALAPILEAMDMDEGIRYVGLPTLVTKHAIPPVVRRGSVQLQRLGFWYDSTHICRTAFYRELFTLRHLHFSPPVEVIDSLVHTSKRPWARQSRMATTIVKKGCSFVEDTLGQLMLAHLRHVKNNKEEVDRVHALYGTWYLVAAEVVVSHLDGREFLTPQARQARGWCKGSNVRVKKRYINMETLPPGREPSHEGWGVEQEEGLLWTAAEMDGSFPDHRTDSTQENEGDISGDQDEGEEPIKVPNVT